MVVNRMTQLDNREKTFLCLLSLNPLLGSNSRRWPAVSLVLYSLRPRTIWKCVFMKLPNSGSHGRRKKGHSHDYRTNQEWKGTASSVFTICEELRNCHGTPMGIRRGVIHHHRMGANRACFWV